MGAGRNDFLFVGWEKTILAERDGGGTSAPARVVFITIAPDRQAFALTPLIRPAGPFPSGGVRGADYVDGKEITLRPFLTHRRYIIRNMARLPIHLPDVVDLARWELDEDNPFGPQGAKPKRFVVSPNPTARPDIISGHRYVFKEPSGHRAMQIWSEVIAYRLARELGLPVPPAFLAVDAIGHPGVLVEFFFGHPGQEPVRFVHAIERFQGLGITTDFRRGSMRDNINLTRQHQVLNWRSWWAEAIAFDSVIGNTDRHSENWGFLVRVDAAGNVRHSLAPIFDNGTSLGFAIRDEDMPRLTTGAAFERFLARGAHHCGWLAGHDETARHASLCHQFMRVHGRGWHRDGSCDSLA